MGLGGGGKSFEGNGEVKLERGAGDGDEAFKGQGDGERIRFGTGRGDNLYGVSALALCRSLGLT